MQCKVKRLGFLSAGAGLLPIAWLQPNHYQPWLGFHSDAIAAGTLLLLLIGVALQARPIWPLLSTVTIFAVFVPISQAALDHVYFFGDALIAALYLLGFSLAQVSGAWVAREYRVESSMAILWGGIAFAAIVSVGLALYQWLGFSGLGIFAADLPPGSRPFANVAQPNMLATVLCLGVVACLALHQARQIGGVSCALMLVFLCFGIAMTQSRTGWVAVTTILVWAAAMRERANLRLTRPALVALALLFGGMVAGWTPLNEALLLSSARSIEQQVGSGVRPALWLSMLDAVLREPWFGYGWNQVSVAQSQVALDHPPTAWLFEHAHNLVLDLLIWNGIPLGLLLIGVLAWWFCRHAAVCREAPVVWLLAGVGVVFVHGMVEFPLEYAYLLLPVGMMMGAVDALSPISPHLRMPRAVTSCVAAVTVALFAWVVVEYVEIEENYRQLRLESARIGTAHIGSDVPDIVLLTQLREFLRFARTEAQRDMPAEQLDWMRKVADRYGYPPVLFRYALAAGLNGQPEVAQATLARLCKTHPAERCREGRDAWQTMAQSKYPELSRVSLESLPEPRVP